MQTFVTSRSQIGHERSSRFNESFTMRLGLEAIVW